jgi:hypothetical protein
MTDIKTKIYITLGRGKETYIRTGEKVEVVVYKTGIGVRYAISQEDSKKRFFLLQTNRKQTDYYVIL